MSVNLRYFRVLPAEREQVTGDQRTWDNFTLQSSKAFSKSLQEALARIPENLNPDEFRDMLGRFLEQSKDPRVFRLEKDWHMLGYLFTGRVNLKDNNLPGDPLHNAIYGGIPLQVQTGYGEAYYYDEPEVAVLANALKTFDRSLARQRFKPRQMEELEIYAVRPEDELEGMFWLIDSLTEVFDQAVASKEQIIRTFI